MNFQDCLKVELKKEQNRLVEKELTLEKLKEDLTWVRDDLQIIEKELHDIFIQLYAKDYDNERITNILEKHINPLIFDYLFNNKTDSVLYYIKAKYRPSDLFIFSYMNDTCENIIYKIEELIEKTKKEIENIVQEIEHTEFCLKGLEEDYLEYCNL